MNKKQILDLYFMEARAKLIDIAAFLDRLDRADRSADFRIEAFRKAITELQGDPPHRAEAVLLAFSDPTVEPVDTAPGKGACGAWPGATS